MKILTKQWYKKMQKVHLSQKERNEIISTIDKATKKTLAFPYYLHDGVLIDFRNKGMNIECVVYTDDEGFSLENRFVKITFVNAKIIEFANDIPLLKDKALIQFLDKKRDKLDCFAIYLYEELYRLNDIYEFHCMIQEKNCASNLSLKYITIQCENIDVEQSYQYE